MRRVSVLAIVSALWVSACAGGGTEAADSGEEEAAETPDATPADHDDELVVGMAADNWATGAETDKKRFPSYPSPNAAVCETLVRLGEDFSVEPGLATEWEYVDDNTFRFHLREDVTFSDGEPLTAEAVKSTMDYVVSEPTNAGLSRLGEDSVTVVDEHTVDITPTEPNLRLVEQIVHPTYAILAPGSDPLNDPEGVVCTGPFTVSEYTPEERLVVERNPDYWGEPAGMEEITFRFYPDDSSRQLALEAGEVDAIAEVPRPQATAVEGLPDVNAFRAPPGQVILAYVARRGPDGQEKVTGDPAVRRAIAHAIDQRAYVEGVLGGEADVVQHVSPPAVLGEYADMVEGVPHDPAEAEQLLEEAGWTGGEADARTKDGEPLILDIIFDPNRIDQPTAEFVQAQLAEVGFDPVIHQLESAAYRDRLNGGDYHLDLSSPNQNDANPAFLLDLRWYSDSFVESAEYNGPGPDTRFDELIEEIKQVTDTDELRELSAEAMHELVDVEVGAVPLAGTYRIYALHKGLEGFDPHPSGTTQTWDGVSWTQ